MTWSCTSPIGAKGAAVGALIGLPIAALILWIMGATGTCGGCGPGARGWASTLLMLVLYPTVIAPLFNKFEPLADESLKARVQALMPRCGFAAKGLFVMDGSKRSAHANAYFTGFGAAKRVVFFDTLLSKLVARRGRGRAGARARPFQAPARAASAWSRCSRSAWPASRCWAGCRRRPGSTPGWACSRRLTRRTTRWRCCCSCWWRRCSRFFVSPLFAQLSRRHEFEADAYACRQASGADLAAALLKLHEDNASTLTPDPVYVRFYYSHPPASERLAALQAQPA